MTLAEDSQCTQDGRETMVLDLGSLRGWGEGGGVRSMSLDTLELTVLTYLTTSLPVFQFPIIDGFFHHRNWRTKGSHDQDIDQSEGSMVM